MEFASKTTFKHRFGILDIFRGLFAFAIVLYHLRLYLTTPLVKNDFVNNCFLFVDFFFALSGFVIAYNYLSVINSLAQVKRFLVKRFFRLYPLHLATLLVMLAYVGLRFAAHMHFSNAAAESFTVPTFFTNLFLLNSVKFRGINTLSWNSPSWSISAEAISYSLFALFTFVAYKIKIKPAAIAFWIVLLAASIFWAYIYFKHQIDFNATFNNGFLRGIIGFFSGVVTQILFQKIAGRVNDQRSLLFTVLEILALLLIIVSVTFGAIGLKIGLIYELVFCGAILIFSFEKGLLSKILERSSLLKNTGKYSYSIYMIHTIVLLFMDIGLKKITGKHVLVDSAICLITIIIIYFLSGWTYRHIELRFYKRHQINSGVQPAKHQITPS